MRTAPHFRRLAGAALISLSVLVAVPSLAGPGAPASAPLGVTTAKGENPTDNALRRTTVPPAIAARADRGYCRDQAAKRKLFGLGRHKFLQRCRKARSKAHIR